MGDLFEQLTNHLTEREIGHWSNPNQQAVCLDFPGLVGFYRVYARISSEDRQLHACGQVSLNVPEGCRHAVAEFVQLAKKQGLDGDLELNQEFGELRFHVAGNLAGDDVSGEVIDRLISQARIGIDSYLRAILSLIFSNEQPADAFRQAVLERPS